MVIKIAEEAYVRAGLARGNERASGTGRTRSPFSRERVSLTQKNLACRCVRVVTHTP